MRRNPGAILTLEASILATAIDLAKAGTMVFHGFELAKQLRDDEGLPAAAGGCLVIGGLVRRQAELEGGSRLIFAGALLKLVAGLEFIPVGIIVVISGLWTGNLQLSEGPDSPDLRPVRPQQADMTRYWFVWLAAAARGLPDASASQPREKSRPRFTPGSRLAFSAGVSRRVVRLRWWSHQSPTRRDHGLGRDRGIGRRGRGRGWRPPRFRRVRRSALPQS